MPAPTALLQSPNGEEGEDSHVLKDTQDDTADFDLDMTTADPETSETQTEPTYTDRPSRVESRKVPIPPHRFSPLKSQWPSIYPPLVEHLKLQVRMNVKSRAVELRTSRYTTDLGALQKGEDFVKAFALGFETQDAIALLRLDHLYLETFEIKDIKTLQGELPSSGALPPSGIYTANSAKHLSRAIGRLAGKDGKTRFAIENASRTRIVLAGQKVHILGAFENIKIAREAIVSLVLGSPPGKVYGNLRKVASRMKERF